MISRQVRRQIRFGAVLLASIGLAPAGAQVAPPAYAEDSSAALNRHLKELADSPRSLSALLGAAKAALDLGDPQAAVTFYARAEEIAPRDGRIKAGIGAAFLAMEQPEPALKFLDEARGLGLPEGAIAADRGLAHDLLGDTVQAQRDYQLAMRANDSDELRRRLALSRAISGDRGGALSAIEDQVRRRDPAGWRVRAFVLALTGDAPGATEAARAAMPAQAAAMQPFFARLPSLRPAERAMAVHFGRFPGDAPAAAMPAPSYASLPPNVILGGRPDSGQTGLGRSAAQAQSTQARPGALASAISRPATPAAPVSINSGRSTAPSGRIASPARVVGSVQGPPDGNLPPSPSARAPAASLASARPGGSAGAAATPGISALDLPPSAPVRIQPSGSRLASIAAAIRALNEPTQNSASVPEQTPAPLASMARDAAPPAITPEPPPSAAPAANPPVLAKRTEIPSPAAKPVVTAKPAAPRRIWVQLGGKPDEAGLVAEFRRLKARTPDLLGDKAAWTAPAGASSSRLLVGPFKTKDDADLFVQLLGDEGLRASSWTSPAGQEIVKLAAK